MDRVAVANPVDRTAAIVTSKGQHFSPEHRPREDYYRREVQPPLKQWRETVGRDLKGIRFGRMVVVGYSAERHGRWIVKCSCGMYEMRTSKAIKNPRNHSDMCMDCRKTYLITHGYDVYEIHRYPLEERLRREQAGEIEPRQPRKG